jgi:hypothetical protein
MRAVHGPTHLSSHLTPDIDWEEVHSVATEGTRAAASADTAAEFAAWGRVADAFRSREPTAEYALIRIGCRLAAIDSDAHPVTASHTAIPVVEDLLRQYVVRVEGLPDTGRAFEGMGNIVFIFRGQTPRTSTLANGKYGSILWITLAITFCNEHQSQSLK